jgi:hypothetical protein
VVRACDCSSISCRSGIVHFFQAISKTLGGGERRFGDSRESFISSEWHILRGVLGRGFAQARRAGILKSAVTARLGGIFFRYGSQKGIIPPRLLAKCHMEDCRTGE